MLQLGDSRVIPHSIGYVLPGVYLIVIKEGCLALANVCALLSVLFKLHFKLLKLI